MSKATIQNVLDQIEYGENNEVSYDTHRDYLQISLLLINRFEIETGHSWSVSANTGPLIEWLQESFEGLRRQTRSSYRCAIRYVYRCHGRDLNLKRTRLTYEEGRALAKNRDTSDLSAQRSKKVDREDLAALLAHAKQKRLEQGGRFRNPYHAVMMLILSSKTGLRPVEWLNATFSPETRTLVVKNAKYSPDQKSYAPTRTLHLDGFSEGDLASLTYFLGKLSRYRGDQISERKRQAFLVRLGESLRALHDEVFPERKGKPRITLYSGRHFFAANAKADPAITPYELSALMGHRSLTTVRASYAAPKRRSARKIELTSSPPSNLRFAAIRREGWGFLLRDAHNQARVCSWRR